MSAGYESRRGFIRCCAAVAAAATLLGTSRTFGESTDSAKTPPLFEAVLDEFVIETLPDGGIDRAKSRWQKPGRGAAVGSNMFPGQIDPRYTRFEAEGLYRFGRRVKREQYVRTADALAGYLPRVIQPTHQTWAIGNALELIGVRHRFDPKAVDANAAIADAKRLVGYARARSLKISMPDGGVTFRHFPCGYGIAQYKCNDAGWTNDLSMFGSGLVHAYELTKDRSMLDDAVSFAEYFVQPWRPKALGEDGFWRCGTWSEKLGTWVIGPSHYSGFESTDAHADEAGWVFSTNTCIDFLSRLHRHHPDERYVDRCVRAAQWTFRECQFNDGAVGMCARDDKWLGFTGAAITQVANVATMLQPDDERLVGLRKGAASANRYLTAHLAQAKVEDHGVEWVKRTTSTDPLVNVAMVWGMALMGWLDAVEKLEAK
jgi:hypothetical protein